MNIPFTIDGNTDPVDYSQYMGCDTIAKLFAKRCAQYGERTAHREKDYGIWKSYTWNEYYQHAQWIALALKELGLKRGEVISIYLKTIENGCILTWLPLVLAPFPRASTPQMLLPNFLFSSIIRKPKSLSSKMMSNWISF